MANGKMAGSPLRRLCVLLMAETVSGAWGPSTGTHISPPFPALAVNQTPMADCRDVCGLNASDRCDFVRATPDCRSGGGYLDYLEGIFCHFPPSLLPLAVTLYVSLGCWWGNGGSGGPGLHCPSPSGPGGPLTCSHGVTFLAFGNGAPDIFSALVAFSDPRTAGLAIGALFGAGVLVTTVVAGGIAILHPFLAASRPFLRDIAFYMAAVFLTFTALYLGRVTLAWALGYLGFYVFYVVTVILCTWIYRWQRRKSLVYSMPGTPETQSDSEEDPVSSNTNSYDYGDEFRPLFNQEESTACILVHALNPLDLRAWRSKSVSWRALKVLKVRPTEPWPVPDLEPFSWPRPAGCPAGAAVLGSSADGVYEIGGLFPVWAVVVIAGTAVASITFFATSNEVPPRLHWLFAFLGFLTSALWINAAATEVVHILRSLGVVFRLSNTVLGLTLLAWGNSIGGDSPGWGYPRMAFSACFGGIIFSILPGCALSCSPQLQPEGLLVWVLAGALGLSLAFSLLAVPLQCFRLRRTYGVCLLLFYLGFLAVALLTEFGVIHLNRT
uniref:Solute carrier family 8 member B1 n=1 Tax=Spermophilus dauricus TaxID=99837 RepID=A0A8C9Q9Z9_SPEDA